MQKLGYTAIIDYQIGNLYSVWHALQAVGIDSVITSDKDVIEKAQAAVLPGVGAFGDAMDNMKALDLIQPIKQFVSTGKPFMGICLGLQLLFTESEEFGRHEGLGLIAGQVKKFDNEMPDGSRVKVPQIGWNRIYKAGQNWERSQLAGVEDGEYMYFVHSFYVVPDHENDVLSKTEYEGTWFCSSIQKDNVFASQFHPEKSSYAGITILKNFANRINIKK
jgi:glutamine amidotransferase